MIYFPFPPLANNDRWIPNLVFPRHFPQQTSMSVKVTARSFSQGGEISWSLSLLHSSATVGIIASKWTESLPVLSFFSHSPVRVWILDKTWQRLSRRPYLSLLFMNGFAEPFPPIDVLVLSKSTLPRCSLSLTTCMASLIFLTSRLYSISSGWARRFWKFYHPLVVGAIDASFTVFSLFRIQDIMPPSFTTSLHLHVVLFVVFCLLQRLGVFLVLRFYFHNI